MGDVSHVKSKRKRRGYNASRRIARLDKKAQRLLDRALGQRPALKRKEIADGSD